MYMLAVGTRIRIWSRLLTCTYYKQQDSAHITEIHTLAGLRYVHVIWPVALVAKHQILYTSKMSSCVSSVVLGVTRSDYLYISIFVNDVYNC